MSNAKSETNRIMWLQFHFYKHNVGVVIIIISYWIVWCTLIQYWTFMMSIHMPSCMTKITQ
jgi:hypothetical protein